MKFFAILFAGLFAAGAVSASTSTAPPVYVLSIETSNVVFLPKKRQQIPGGKVKVRLGHSKPLSSRIVYSTLEFLCNKGTVTITDVTAYDALGKIIGQKKVAVPLEPEAGSILATVGSLACDKPSPPVVLMTAESFAALLAEHWVSAQRSTT